MSKIIEAWQNLPFGKRRQLASLHGIKDFGTTETQLEWDLENKLPKGLLAVEEPTEEVGEPPEGTGQEPVLEPEVKVKQVKPKKKAKK